MESALQEVRAAPRSGEAWGKLGSVLMHYEFIDETREAFEQAEALSLREPRWPHLHGLALSTRDVALATEKFRRATDLNVERSTLNIQRSEAPRLRLAQVLAERGLDKEAESEFQTLLRIAPNHPLAQLGLARIRHSQGRLAEATNLLRGELRGQRAEVGLRTSPLGPLTSHHTARSAHALLAAIEQALGNAPAAAAAAHASVTLPVDAPWPDPWWTEALAYRVGRKALFEDATALMDQGSLPEALAILDRATRDYPQDEEVWYLLGWALNQRQRPGDAERALREHLRLSPQSPKGHAQLAVALLGQQRHAEAAGVLQTALKLKPTWRELHSNLGFACVQLGRDEEAIGHFRNALALDPNYLASYTALAELLGRRGKRAEARRLLQQALDLDPSDVRAGAMLQRMEPGR
jgi:tetratricopeptide (TPR) repeat protein